MLEEHQWSGWPGARCLKCGIEDPREGCLANNPNCQCGLGPDEEGNPIGGPCVAEMPPCAVQTSSEDIADMVTIPREDIELAWDLALEHEGGEKILQELEEKGAKGDPARWLLWILKDLKEKMDSATTQPEERQKRFQAMQLIFSLPFAEDDSK